MTPPTTKSCPTCGSSDTRPFKGAIHRAAGASKPEFFQVVPNRSCDKCGTMWRPRCPPWTAWLTIVVSAALLVVGVLVLYGCLRFQINGDLPDAFVSMSEMFGSSSSEIVWRMSIFGLVWTVVAAASLRKGLRLRGEGGHLVILQHGHTGPDTQ